MKAANGSDDKSGFAHNGFAGDFRAARTLYRPEASAFPCTKPGIAFQSKLKSVAAFVEVVTLLIMPKHEEES